ncbi:MAG: 2-oxoacid:acceptor oxidoreductase family protein, partial [Desulfobacterales bacterium]|nr:2-oxoacid:acceptor oxidoreductase family protein [Desulfobacterales bacterium]
MTNTKHPGQKKTEIIITGFGGQGIILAGFILGKAAAIGDKMESTLIQSYGPESRGGSCSAQVVISRETIHYPYVTTPDILVCMSQSGYDKLSRQMKKNGILIIDQDLVRP